MKKLLILFSFILLLSNWSISQQNSIDSTTISKIVRLINDYKACEEYSQDLELRLIEAKEIINRVVQERDEYERLFNEVDNALKDMTSRKERLEKKLKRTRKIGFVGSIVGFVGGVVLTVLIF